jgi:hypothetical protein
MSVSQTAASGKDRTVWAVVVCILLVIPAFIPAGIVTLIYQFFLRGYVSDTWIPYRPEISMQWFPEMLRGMIVGWCAIYATQAIIKTANYQAVRFAAASFWLAVMIVGGLLGLAMTGPTIDIVGMIAFALGFVLGVFNDEFF